jgi:hypothetical protein
MRSRSIIPFMTVALLLGVTPARPEVGMLVVAAAPQADQPPKEGSEEALSPEERMRRRFPQPIRAGDLIGLPVLDWQDSTIGYIRDVVRTPAGKIQLVVPYGRWLGWARTECLLSWCRRPVAVALETVAILGRQVGVLDMTREEFDAAPTFQPTQASPIPHDDTFAIAITRR